MGNDTDVSHYRNGHSAVTGLGNISVFNPKEIYFAFVVPPFVVPSFPGWFLPRELMPDLLHVLFLSLRGRCDAGQEWACVFSALPSLL